MTLPLQLVSGKTPPAVTLHVAAKTSLLFTLLIKVLIPETILLKEQHFWPTKLWLQSSVSLSVVVVVLVL